MEPFWNRLKSAAAVAKKAATYVVTAGGSVAVQRSVEDCTQQLPAHRSSERTFGAARTKFDREVANLGGETEECIKLLKDAQELISRLSFSGIRTSIPGIPSFRPPLLSTVNDVIDGFNAVQIAGRGAGAGVGAIAGAWVLVAHLGVASTGTAIAALSGVAAHNAILAWFGGGALAAGGGGMALGAFAVGGIGVLPMIGYSAYVSYKEASRIQKERREIEDATRSNEQHAMELIALSVDAVNLKSKLALQRSKFLSELGFVRDDASKLAERLASAANMFAGDLVSSSLEHGAKGRETPRTSQSSRPEPDPLEMEDRHHLLPLPPWRG